MEQKLNQLEQMILLGATEDLLRIRKSRHPNGENWYHFQHAKSDARLNLVRLCPARWCGRLFENQAERMCVSRAYCGLERAGLAERVRGSLSAEGATHLRLTPEGIAFARQLLKVLTS
jgi:hypothetical protein